MASIDDMIKIVVSKNGKVQGIPHLYKDRRSDRYYVRYAKGCIDRQMTLEVKSETFSWLEREALRVYKLLKKECEPLVSTTTKPVVAPVVTKSVLELGIEQLQSEIEIVWSARGVTGDRLNRLQTFCKGLAIAAPTLSQGDIAKIDAHNKNVVIQKINDETKTAYTKERIYIEITTVFKLLREVGKHVGTVPTAEVARPSYTAPRENRTINFRDSAKIIKVIRSDLRISQIQRKEYELFVRLSAETGQRPTDIYALEIDKIEDRHYRFTSHKTKRTQRVQHLISNTTYALIREIVDLRNGTRAFKHTWGKRNANSHTGFLSFWTISFDTMSRKLNEYTHEALGDKAKYYTIKHFFITELFKKTQSDFWAEVFTHEGRGANARNYRLIDQEQADDILREISWNLSRLPAMKSWMGAA